jgi:hypothetical protein
MCEPHKEIDLAEALAAMGFVSGGELMEGVIVYFPTPQAPAPSSPESNKEVNHDNE